MMFLKDVALNKQSHFNPINKVRNASSNLALEIGIEKKKCKTDLNKNKNKIDNFK
jgi:hypothetical protein